MIKKVPILLTSVSIFLFSIMAIGVSPCNEETFTIITHKIVCENEADLPNWGTGGPDITSSTAQNFVDTNPNCHFDEGWYFQLGPSSVSNPGDNTGEAGSGWITFGPTGQNGKATINVNNPDTNNEIRVREVFKQGYIHFTYNIDGQSNKDDISAEFYCHNDVQNYDNFDYIVNPETERTYYCIAFNVLESVPPSPPEKKGSSGELLITSFIPDQECVAPGDELLLYVSVKNEGDKKLKDVRVTASIQDLNIRVPFGPYTIKKNSPISRVIFFNIPDYTKPGIYYIRLTATSGDDSTAKHRIIEVNDAC